MSDTDGLSGYRRLILCWVSGACAVIVLPFTINNLLHQRWLVGAGAVIVCFILMSTAVALHLERRPPVPLLLLVPAVAVFLVTCFEKQGVIAAFWSYPAIVMFYVILPPRQARWTSVLLLAVVVPCAFMHLPAEHAARVAASLVGVIVSPAIFVHLLGLQRAELDAEKAKVEEHLRQLQRSEEMRRNLTHMLVHDLRTPLTAIIGHAYLARKHGGEADIERVAELSTGLVEMVSRILDVDRLESGEFPLAPERVAVRSLLDGALRELGGQEKQVLVEGGQDVDLWCDPHLTQRVLTNLLANALRFSPPQTPVTVLLTPVGTELEVSVVDGGPGVALEDQARVFDKYAQGPERGRVNSGLGLTFCKLAVERHGGQIGLVSRPGHGARFWFRLPLAADGALIYT